MNSPRSQVPGPRFRVLLRATLLLFVLALPLQGTADEKLHVAYIYDERFPRPFDGELKHLLKQAAKTLGDKLGGKVEFGVVEQVALEDFFAKHLDKFTYYEIKARVGYPVFKTLETSVYLDAVAAFLERWRLAELRAFFPAAPADADRAWVARELLKAYAERIGALKGLSYADGQPFLEKKGYVYHSYLAWATAASAQKEWELLVTNAPIVYDHITQPYPHNVLKKAMLGGVSLAGQPKQSGLNRVVLLSLAAFADGRPSFLEPSLAGHSEKEKAKVAGGYLLAHELGHAIYLVPDVYDHSPHCLMHTTFANMEYWSGYLELTAERKRCPQCEPYRVAREKLVSADRHYAKKKYDKALKDYRQSEERLPEFISGERKVIAARLMLKQLKCLIFLARRTEALALVDRLIASDPENKEFKRLRFSVVDMGKDVWKLPEDERKEKR